MTLYLTDRTTLAEITRGQGERLRARREALPGRRHHPLGGRRHRSRAPRRGARAHGGAGPGAAGARGGHRPGGGRVRSRGALHRRRCSRRSPSGIRACASCSSTSPPSAAVQFVLGARAGIAATVTPQHLLLNRNALFAGGIRPHHYCLPVLKAERAPRGAAGGGGRAARRASSWAPTAPRTRGSAKEMRLRLRRHLLRARGDRAVRARPSRPPARSSSSRPSPPSTARTSTRLPRNRDSMTLVQEAWQVPAQLPLRRGRAGAAARRRAHRLAPRAAAGVRT